MSKRHPLKREDNWSFHQSLMKLKTSVYRTVKRGVETRAKSGKVNIETYDDHSCREEIIGEVRDCLENAALAEETRIPGTWQSEWRSGATLNTTHSSLKKPGLSYISVDQAHLTYGLMVDNPHYLTPAQRRAKGLLSRANYYQGCNISSRTVMSQDEAQTVSAEQVQSFLDLCDLLVGPLTVLLNPDRYQGDWWFTGTSDALTPSKYGGMIKWYGVDNTVIQHPALTSLYLGLVRQCALLSKTRCVDRIFQDLGRLNLEDCLNDSDPDLALRIARKMSRWIAVPLPKFANRSHLPVGDSQFSRIVDLHKSIYKHGFEETFDASFEEGWALGQVYSPRNSEEYLGIHHYMGSSKYNAKGRRIRTLAAKRTSRVEKS
jgi:hypothetical protein